MSDPTERGTPVHDARRTQRWLRSSLAVLALVTFGAACGEADDGEGSAPATTSVDDPTTSTSGAPVTTTTEPAPLDGPGPCGLDEGEDVFFSGGRADVQLHGVLAGRGDTAIVLAHENRQEACDWAFYIPTLVERGYQVLAFDFVGAGQTTGAYDGHLELDVLAAVDEARARGAARVVAIGASRGGTGVIAAAATADSGIDGLVTLSAPDWSHSTNALEVVSGVEVPALFVAADLDRSFDAHVEAFADGCSCRWKEELVVEGSAHGVRLLQADQRTEIERAIERLLAAVTAT
jgi:alpha/beta superfamily hydrolase